MAENLGLGALVLIALALSVWWLFDGLRSFIAPDVVDQEDIEDKHGRDTPAALEKLVERFGPDQHWYDGKTGLIGLVSLVVLGWFVFS
ncbi:hypothetical protein [Altererythrobacter sp. MTPC7]|uniref:hypothetical protein n=1 Tax=Altererythrobacter sp. MTPC7 TaxID=3056567 RepID=UPI0036F1CA4A